MINVNEVVVDLNYRTLQKDEQRRSAVDLYQPASGEQLDDPVMLHNLIYNSQATLAVDDEGSQEVFSVNPRPESELFASYGPTDPPIPVHPKRGRAVAGQPPPQQHNPYFQSMQNNINTNNINASELIINNHYDESSMILHSNKNNIHNRNFMSAEKPH